MKPAACLSVLIMATVLMPLPARSQSLPPPAYMLAASRAQVPSSVLYAVALQESGTRWRGRLVPWPWTLNVAGTPMRFASHGLACAALQSALKDTPRRRIDVGLGQINLGYHPQRYRQPCDLLNPYDNLAITADILRGQRQPGEDWLPAIGRYHRPAGGAAAQQYRRSVSRHLQRMRQAQQAQPGQAS